MIATGWQKKDTIALAVSGGIDSMVLYHLLTVPYKNSYRKLILFHVNHGVRQASRDEERAIIEMAERDGIEISVCHLNMAGHFTQNEARKARFQFFDEKMAGYQADYLLTAHHLNDHDETIMHQLLTGRYTHQHVGIESVTKRSGYSVLRPLMHISKKDIERYQKRHKIRYFEDTSNSEVNYTRNYIRHHVMPGIYQSDDLYEASLRTLADDLNEYTAHMIKYAASFLEAHGSELRKSALLKEGTLQQFYILKVWLQQFDINISRKGAASFINTLNASSQVDFNIEGRVIAVRYDDIRLLETRSVIAQSITADRTGEYLFNGYTVTVKDPSVLPLTIRTREDGDKVMLENIGTKKISRILIDHKIIREERDKMPVIVDKDGTIIALGTIYNIMNTRGQSNRLIIKKEFSHDAEK